MDFRLSGSAAFVWGVGWRVLMAAGFSALFLYVVGHTQYYATALVLAAGTALALADLVRLSRQPAPHIATAMRAQHHDQARRLDQMAALLDAVTVALVAVTPDGEITFVNRAARLLIGEDVGWLRDIRSLGTETANLLLTLPPGSRQILTLADGGSVLAWSGGFSAPGLPPQKLISLQTVMGELDAVQLRAWQAMTRVLSHEMMNSLTPISSLSESLPALLASNAHKDAADAVETIARRSRHLMNFVERYRQIASLPEPEPREIKLADFVADTGALMAPIFAARGIAYHDAVDPPDLVLSADPELLNQAVINLLHNAADAVAAVKTPRVELHARRNGNEIVFQVCDNGPGIPAGRLEEIFIPFFTTKPGGSGIGLALARQIAHAHRGQLDAAPGAGAGMTFSISIPDKR